MARKPKFNSAQKLSILKEAKEKGIYEISKKYSINNKTIQQWCLLYKYQGIEGLKSKRTNQSYSLNFKISLVTSFMESGDSLSNFAIKRELMHQKKSDCRKIPQSDHIVYFIYLNLYT